MAENFTTYTETDPNSKLVVTSTRITATQINRNEDAYVYKNKGNYFTGNFEIQLTLHFTDGVGATAIAFIWTLANLVDDWTGIDTASGDALGIAVAAYGSSPNTYIRLQMIELNGGAEVGTDSSTYDQVMGTSTYLTIVRDESVGTYGTLYCYIYSDAARAVLEDTLTITLHSKKDFSYLYGIQSNNTGNAAIWWSGYVENLTVVSSVFSGEAPSVTTQAVSSIASTTATGNGNVTGLGLPTATQHGHVWASHPNPTTSDSKTENGVPSATGAYTSSLTSLSPNTLYYCRAYIINELGKFYSNTTVTFTTTASTAVVTTRAVSAIAALSATGNGTITSDGGSAITAHGVCWSTSANPTTANDHTDNGATTVIGDFSSLMTGLTANTAYHVRAYVTNGSGTSYGADVTFTTLAAGAPIVTIQPCTDVQPTTATGNGTIVNIGGSAVTQHGHCWSTSINPTTSSSKTSNGAGSVGAFTSLITGLTAGTPYYVRAYATNTQGTSYSDNELVNYDNPEVPPGTAPADTPSTISTLDEYLVYRSVTGKRRALLGEEY